MLTPDGQRALAADTAARLEGGTVRVSDGSSSAESPILAVTASRSRPSSAARMRTSSGA